MVQRLPPQSGGLDTGVQLQGLGASVHIRRHHHGPQAGVFAGQQVGQSAHGLELAGERDAGLFMQFAQRSRPGAGIRRVHPPARKGHMARPRITVALGAAHHQHRRAIARTIYTLVRKQ